MAELSPLRRRMIEDMTIRNMSPAAQRSYISAVSKFSRYFGRSPDKLTLDDVHAFQVHLVSMGISWPGLNQIVCALQAPSTEATDPKQGQHWGGIPPRQRRSHRQTDARSEGDEDKRDRRGYDCAREDRTPMHIRRRRMAGSLSINRPSSPSLTARGAISESQEGEDEHDHDDQSNEIDQTVHNHHLQRRHGNSNG